MGIFDKVMASAFGVGATKVDTIVHTKNLMPGSKIEGICKINGGKIEQYINDITIGVYTSYKKEVNDNTVTEIQRIQEHTININKQILPGETYEVNFSFVLYKIVPVTIHKSQVWLSTNLNIEAGVDSSDRDYLKIDYNEYMKNTVNAISDLGFSLREVENEYCSKRLNGLKFVQEFEFVPTRGHFRGRLDELELVFIPTNTHVDILLEVDRKARGLISFISESLDLDETKLKIRLENSKRYSYEEIKSTIQQLLIKYS
ncbi:MAG: sporulation protein [Romboutsia sp.]|uniref:sporulation protein n=1 Tax=Romboutsia sp. TaxID=1965302 RepID=UPI003F3C52D0